MVKTVKAKSLLIKHKQIDSWFISGYGMNLYRGCVHDCSYCDGRDEKYQVSGAFGKDVQAKINAPELLDKALNPKGKRTPFKNGYIMVGGGVGDSYQPVEKELELTRQVLDVLVQYGRPAHFLTKNGLIERDLKLIKDLHDRAQVIVSMSFSSVDDKISAILEPGCSLPKDKLMTLKRFKEAGIPTGMFLMPVIPFITDIPAMIEASVAKAKEADVDFIIFGTMTLKEGKQAEHFMKVISMNFPAVKEFYRQIYTGDRWGNTTSQYARQVSENFTKAVKKYRVARRIPLVLYENIVSENEKVALLLEHLDYCLKQDDKPSPYGHAAYQIRKLAEPVSTVKALTAIKGVGPFTEKIIKEIVRKGQSHYINKLVNLM